MRFTSKRFTLATLFSVAASVTACTTEPQSSRLEGEYGGVGLALVASEIEARWEFRCASGRTGPLVLDASGTARADGIVGFTAAGAPARELIVNVQRVDVLTLEVSVRFGPDASPQLYQVIRDAEPDTAAICLASAEAPQHPDHRDGAA